MDKVAPDAASAASSSLLDNLAPKIMQYMQEYSARLDQYLASTEATLEVYRFDVRKLENGITIDVEIRVRMKLGRVKASN